MLRLLFLLCASVLFAEEVDPWSIISTENSPSTVVEGKVNVITGKWCAVERDLVIQGAEPVTISRSFVGVDTGDWQVTPSIHVEGVKNHHEDHFIVTEPSGAKIKYNYTREIIIVGDEKFKRYKPANLSNGYTNTSRGVISGRTNIANNVLMVGKKRKLFVIRCASGSVRTYRKIHNGEGEYRLLTELLPNGNWILYDYEEVSLGDKKGTVTNLISIRSTDPSRQKEYARADFLYEDPKRKNKHFFIKGSDGQVVEYNYAIENDSKKQTGALKEVVTNSTSRRSFGYMKSRYLESQTPHEIHGLESITLPLGRVSKVDYYTLENTTVCGHAIELDHTSYCIDPDCNIPDYIFIPDPRSWRVKTLYAPKGSSPDLLPTHWFVYDVTNRKTSVYDIENQRVDYFWGEDCRLQKVACYDANHQLLRIEKLLWSETGNLLCTSLLDGNEQPYLAKRYIYDDLGNILEERIFGNLSGRGKTLVLDDLGRPLDNGAESYARRFTYDSGRISLLHSEEDDRGKRIEYTYQVGTDRKISQLIYDHGELKQRKFWEYNEDGILIREISDDGSSPDPINMTGVKQRTLVQITPNPQGPYLGLPWIIEEKFWENGKEPLLRKTVLTYTTGARIAQRDFYDATGAFSHSLHYRYDAQGRLIEQSNAIGQSERFAYDACGNRIVHDHYSRRVHAKFSYDYSNCLIESHQTGDDGVELKETYSYDRKGRLLHEEKPLGHSAHFTYDASGQLAQKELPPLQGQRHLYTFEYDSLGRCLKEIDPEGHATKKAYNAYGQPIRIEHPDGAIEQLIYDLDGKLSTAIDALGVETHYTYDALGRLTSTTRVLKGEVLSQEANRYDSCQKIAQIDAEGSETIYSYDGAGRLIATELGGETLEYRYDALGRLQYEIVEDSYKVKEYDLLDRLIEERQENAQGQILQQIRYAYDEAGNQSAVIRRINNQDSITRTLYDSLSRPIQTIDALGNETHLSYEATPCLKETRIDPMGLKTLKQYNALRQISLLEVVSSQGVLLKREEMHYNYRGKILEQASTIFDPPREIKTQWRYDALGRETLLIEAAGTQEEKRTQTVYDANGRVQQTIKPDQTTLNYSYTPLGHLALLTSSDRTVHLSYLRDRLGRELASTDNTTGQTTLKEYEPHGRIIRETLGTGAVLERTYDRAGRLKELILPDQSTIRYAYNAHLLTQVSRHRFSERLYPDFRIFDQKNEIGSLMNNSKLKM